MENLQHYYNQEIKSKEAEKTEKLKSKLDSSWGVVEKPQPETRKLDSSWGEPADKKQNIDKWYPDNNKGHATGETGLNRGAKRKFDDLGDWTTGYDGTLPGEILSQCTEFECGLCRAKLNSGISAQHYQGAPHHKMVKISLHEYAKKTGESVPKSIKGDKVAQSWWNTFRCEPCLVSMSSQDTFDAHILGKKHQKTLAKANVGGGQADVNKFRCEPCGINVTSAMMLEAHQKGAKHLKKMNQPSNGESAATTPKTAKKPAEVFRCEVCVISASSQDALNAHLVGKAHTKKANAKQVSQHWCGTCRVTCMGAAALEAHNEGKNHQRVLKNLETTNLNVAQSQVKNYMLF